MALRTFHIQVQDVVGADISEMLKTLARKTYCLPTLACTTTLTRTRTGRNTPPLAFVSKKDDVPQQSVSGAWRNTHQLLLLGDEV